MVSGGSNFDTDPTNSVSHLQLNFETSMRSVRLIVRPQFVSEVFLTEETLYIIELWRTTALIYVDNGQYYTVSRRTPDKEIWPCFGSD